MLHFQQNKGGGKDAVLGFLLTFVPHPKSSPIPKVVAAVVQEFSAIGYSGNKFGASK